MHLNSMHTCMRLHQYSHKKGTACVCTCRQTCCIYDVDMLCISIRPYLHTSDPICLLYIVCKVNQKQRNFHFILIRSTSVLCSLHWSRSPHCVLYLCFFLCLQTSLFGFLLFPFVPMQKSECQMIGEEKRQKR